MAGDWKPRHTYGDGDTRAGFDALEYISEEDLNGKRHIATNWRGRVLTLLTFDDSIRFCA